MSVLELELAAETPRRFAIGDEDRMGAGRQGTVYAVEFDPTLAVKIYHRQKDRDQARLEAMILTATPRDFEIVPLGASAPHLQLAWPTHLVREPETGEVVGYTMPVYPNDEYCRLDVLWELRLRQAEVPNANWLFLLTVARNLATLTAMVHERGLVLGDVRDANFVFSPRTGLVALLDCDSMPITDPRTADHFPCFLTHEEYAPPELAADPNHPRTFATDNFSLAILICRLLLAGVHPFTGYPAINGDDDGEVGVGANIRAGRSYLVAPNEVLLGDVVDPEVIPHAVSKLARRAFSTGLREPDKRPDAGEWRSALSAALKQVSDCEIYPRRHKYSSELWTCPWCRSSDPFPAAPDPPSQGSPLLGAIVLVLTLIVLAVVAAALLLSGVI
jgi:DNA-binding helix-hairpin-helix protein with protein kinase domain